MKYANREQRTIANETRARLTKAFALMRKEGFIARRNFMCCRSCASSAIAAEVQKRGDRQIKGSCFYSRQNGLDTDDGVVRDIHLSYSAHSNYRHEWVAKTICKCLTKSGLAYDWDGSVETCIAVKPFNPGAVEPVKKATPTSWDWLSVDPLG